MGIGSSPELYGKVMTGYDFYYNDTITNDDIECHGTFVAGIIGSNHQYMKGVNQNISLIPLQVDNGTTMSMFDNEIIPIPGFDHDSFLPALNSITENGRFGYLDIINLSLGSNNTDLAIYTAIANYNGLFVCGAGNEGNNIDTAPYYCAIYPAKYGSSSLGENELNNMIVVGALDQNGNRWYYTYYESSLGSTIPLGSNYGINTVDIYAPGVDILSIIPIDYCSSKSDIVDSDCGPKRRCECTRSAGNWIFGSEHVANGYHYKSGTSFATPMVTGGAALLSSINPELTASQLKECILGGADNITIMVGDNNNEPQNVKKLNAWGAFKYLMDNYYTYESNEMQSIGNYSNVKTFTDTIVSIGSYSTFKENTSFIKLEIEDDGHYQFAASADNDIKLCLYDSFYELIISRSAYSETEASVEFLVYLEAGTYYLKTNFTEEITGDGLISFAVEFTEEIHTVSEYVRYTSTHHQCICGCGYDMGIEPHTVILSEVVLGMARCIYCGARVMLDDTIVQVPGMLNIQKVTINGSYILPSGIIVLVNEDIEAYENGTLIFYDKDNLPQTE